MFRAHIYSICVHIFAKSCAYIWNRYVHIFATAVLVLCICVCMNSTVLCNFLEYLCVHIKQLFTAFLCTYFHSHLQICATVTCMSGVSTMLHFLAQSFWWVVYFDLLLIKNGSIVNILSDSRTRRGQYGSCYSAGWCVVSLQESNSLPLKGCRGLFDSQEDIPWIFNSLSQTVSQIYPIL